MRNRGIVIAAIFIVTVLGVLSPAAIATEASGPVEELLGCWPKASAPSYSNGAVSGSGSASCSGGEYVEIIVCVEYAQVPMACADASGAGSASATASDQGCLPGVWQTMVIMRTLSGSAKAHSAPKLINCPITAGP